MYQSAVIKLSKAISLDFNFSICKNLLQVSTLIFRIFAGALTPHFRKKKFRANLFCLCKVLEANGVGLRQNITSALKIDMPEENPVSNSKAEHIESNFCPKTCLNLVLQHFYKINIGTGKTNKKYAIIFLWC